MHNLYLPVYKNLENEVIDLAYKIHFDDDQRNVYSIKIAELLVRCCVEIEAISKDLYLSNDGNPDPVDESGKKRDLYFDTDCLAYLGSKWLLSKKIVYTSSPNFYFTKDENKILTPLKKANKRGTSGANWKQAYQKVKHNRSQNIKYANMKNLIHAMAALYLLNIYYKDKGGQYIGKIENLNDFDNTIESSLFAVDLFFLEEPELHCNSGIVIMHAYESAVYIGKLIDEDYYRDYLGHITKNQDWFLKTSARHKDILEQNPSYENQKANLYSICKKTDNMDFYWDVRGVAFKNTSSGVFLNYSYEIVLNKNQEIYPTES